MKKALRTSALACAAICLSFGLTSTPAKAEDSAMVRTAQMRLAGLGYYVGQYDGLMGPVTQSAIIDFQRAHGLPMTGHLGVNTYNMLLTSNYATYAAYTPYMYHHMGYYGYHMVDPVLLPVAWDTSWHYVHTQSIPSRFATLDIREDDTGSMRHYAVTMNGKAVLFADNQPSILRVSRTFAMDGEDAVIFTAYNGDSMCSYKNYLLTVRADGTYVGPREVGNCASSYEAHVADNALFMSFPDAWMGSDVWRYENASLIRL